MLDLPLLAVDGTPTSLRHRAGYGRPLLAVFLRHLG